MTDNTKIKTEAKNSIWEHLHKLNGFLILAMASFTFFMTLDSPEKDRDWTFTFVLAVLGFESIFIAFFIRQITVTRYSSENISKGIYQLKDIAEKLDINLRKQNRLSQKQLEILESSNNNKEKKDP